MVSLIAHTFTSDQCMPISLREIPDVSLICKITHSLSGVLNYMFQGIRLGGDIHHITLARWD